MKYIVKTPPMGWNSYDYYDTTVSEEQVKANADYMARNLKEFGWEYIVVDISWYSHEAGEQREKYQYVPFAKLEMDEYSRLLPCVERFPSSANGKGFAPLAEYIHSLGLKFGIHMMRGIPRIAAHQKTLIKGTAVTANQIADAYNICKWNPDMYGLIPDAEGAQEYYDSLMELYAGWGVDLIKCDDICRMDEPSCRQEIIMIHSAIQKCGRQIVLSLSPGPALLNEWKFYQEYATIWRITDDFWDHWDSLRDMFDRCRAWQDYVREGSYPDCDMLPIGTLGKGFGEERQSGFTFEEQKTMMSLWCMFRSPLMIGAELTKLDSLTLSLLTNKELLRMHSQSSGAREIYRDSDFIAWEASERQGTRKYLAVFNISDTAREVDFHCFADNIPEEVGELWTENILDTKQTYELPKHGCYVIYY